MKQTMQHKVAEMNFLLYWNLQKTKKKLRELWEDEDGIGSVELVLILVVLVGLVGIFRDKLKELVEKMFGTISTDAKNLEI